MWVVGGWDVRGKGCVLWATARNGRHITPTLYHNYHDLKKKHGAEAAKQIIRRGLTEENQCRECNVFFDKDVFEGIKEKLGCYLEELPSEKGGWGTTKGSAGMQLTDGVCGVVSTTGGTVHPYRLVTGILSRLLKMYLSFRLYTHTSRLSIYDNIVHTPHWDIHAKHIVRTTNGWTSLLLTPMQEKIIPVHVHMTVQRARMGLGDGWLALHWRHILIQHDGYTNPSRRDNKTYYSNLPNVTIAAPIEDGLSIEDIKVPNQRAYTGPKPVIPSSLADTPSASLGVVGLMKTLNSTLGTEYDITPSLSSLLTEYISHEYDFGTVYGYLHPIWFDCDLNDIQDSLRISEATDLEIRQEALVDGQITEEGLRMAPRRVWDLFSNRVVPWWVALHTPWGISHAWLDNSHRANVLTPINEHEWPVPIPKDANLDLVRIEMLNLGAEYAWLDVLCLRQEGGRREDLRAREWMLDVPNIGNAYLLEKVVCYFNGLGQPLDGGFDSDSARSWFKRTWTLQETSHNWTIGGDTGDKMLNKRVRKRFKSQLSSVEQAKRDVVHWLSLLQGRTSEKDVDKVAALTYFLAMGSTPAHNETRPTTSTTHDYTKISPTSKDNSIGTGDPTSTIAPAYSELKSAEDAWTALVKVIRWYHRSQMLFLYHEPGPEKNAWRPSWQQAMNWDTRTFSSVFYGSVNHDMKPGTYSYDGWRIESVQVQGLATPVAAPRNGHLIVQTRSWYRGKHRCRYKISAGHQYPIPDGVYSLLFAEYPISNETPCVVGKMLPDQTFIKTSVFEVIDWPRDEKKWKRMGAKESRIFLG
ncbi:uncharacterized protein ARMOST_06401 [Armillaria ostoyae]|uniref:Heterokaryon incompatibility domain-containing protein n=1 Tax=Armillaria ostoyae TaxID=47428 RepID=A0A284R2W3_ARMOS|nr:uncharacterized protein ARMOST_06401 [Armillaria ostoyae]